MSNSAFKQMAQDLASYIDNSPTAFHAASETIRILKAAGATELCEFEPWSLKENSLYYLLRDGSAVIAFSTAGLDPSKTGVRISAAHLDSPLLKLKGCKLEIAEDILCGGIEVYGGPIFASWLDRDLILAGRCVVRDGGSLIEINFCLENIEAIIPNVAIHMNREINKELTYNPQKDLRVLLFPSSPTEDSNVDIRYYIADELKIKMEDILDVETFFVPAEKASIMLSTNANSIIRSGRIDNLTGSYAALRGFVASDPHTHTAPSFICLYNSEEIGSRTRSGANGVFFNSVLQRFFDVAGLGAEDQIIARQKSFQISIDGAHAVHPNYSDKHDSQYRPKLNCGVVIKKSAGYKYGTDAPVASRLMELASGIGLKLQEIVNRADVPSGATIGTVSMTLTDIPTVDIGIPMLSMHSTRETGGLTDQRDMIALITAFHSGGVTAPPKRM